MLRMQLVWSEHTLLAHQRDKYAAVLTRQRAKVLRGRAEADEQGAKLYKGHALVQVREPLIEYRRRLVWLVLHPQYVAWYESDKHPLPLGKIPLRGTSLRRAALGQFHRVDLHAAPAIVLRHGESVGRVARPLLSVARIGAAVEKAGARVERTVNNASLRPADAPRTAPPCRPRAAAPHRGRAAVTGWRS